YEEEGWSEWKDEARQHDLGSASNSRRTPETGHNCFGGVRCQIHGPPSQAAIPNVENVPRQSYVPTRFDRFLHGTHDLVRDSVRLRRARTSPSARRPFQCDGSSDGGVDRTANRRSVSFRQLT